MHYQGMEPLPTIQNLDCEAEIPILSIADCVELQRMLDLKPRPLEYTIHTDIEVQISFGKHVPKEEYAYNRRNYRISYVGEIKGHYKLVGFEHVRETPTGPPVDEFHYAAWVYFDHDTGESCNAVSFLCFGTKIDEVG